MAWAGSVQAGSYRVVYQEQIEGAETYSHIDPVLGSSLLPVAFVYTDTTDRQFLIDFVGVDSTIVIGTVHKPLMSLNLWTPDSVLVFALSRMTDGLYWMMPDLRRIRLDANGINDSAVLAVMPGWYGQSNSVQFQRILFGSLQLGAPGIVLEQSILFENYETTQGWEYKQVSGACIYDFNLNLQTSLRPFTALRPGNLTDDPGLEYAWYFDYYYSYDFRDSWDDPNYGTWASLYAGVCSNSGDTLLTAETTSGTCLQLFADDFIQGNIHDEVVFYGKAVDLTGQHASAYHVACYSFASGSPEQIWYLPLSGVTLDYVYKPQHYIAGMRGLNKMIALNYWTGQLSDSVSLDRNLAATMFFETGSNPPVLNLVGRSYDTIFVYQFDTPTDVADETDIILPSSIDLAQNYPNPFNNETVISFSNHTRQRLTLKICNVLGQEVVTLYDTEAAAGDFSVAWNGQDASQRTVSSGVYFARLVSPGSAAMIKMVLLK
jgi:hypothetical protein